jgi:hypothetical protein
MKGISLSLKLVADVLIALVGVLVVFSIFNTMLPQYTTPALCKIYRGISVLPLPDFLKTSHPECSSLYPTKENVRLNERKSSDIEERLADFIIDCWKNKADSGKLGMTFQCYEIYIRSVDGTIKESGVNNIFKSKNYCQELSNNFLDQEKKDFDCGSENRIYWKNDFSGDDVTIIIKYSAFPIHRIEVI